MTAFNRAFNLLKMPIVPGSVYRKRENASDEGDDFKRYGGAFDDPETGERMNMEAIYQPTGRSGSINATINAPVDDTYKLHPRAKGTFTLRDTINYNPKPWMNDHMKWSAEMINTDDEHQRKGYATGIYDLVSYILNRHGSELVPSPEQTKEGSGLWDSLSDDEYAEIERWQVRDDLE